MTALDRLKELAKTWRFVLDFDGTDYSLMLLGSEGGTTRYVSANLDRLINHAWAGAPAGRC